METLKEALKVAGLTDREADVYLLLGKKPFLTGMDVARLLNMHKAQAYAILAKLQEKHMIDPTVGTPTRYIPIQIETALDAAITAKRFEADSIAKNKEQILAYWKGMQPLQVDAVKERVATLPTRNAVESRVLEMIGSAEQEVYLLLGTAEVIRANNSGVFDALGVRLAKRRDLQAMILAPIVMENLTIAKRFVKMARDKALATEWRHTDIDSMQISSLLVRDGEECCVLPPGDLMPGTPNLALWTNGRTVTRICLALFAELWRGKAIADQRIKELEFSKPSITEEIDDPRVARKRFLDRIQKTESEVTHLLPSARFLKDKELRLFWETPARGIRVRILCPFDSTLKTERRSGRQWEVRDPEINYLAISTIDRYHLFRFNLPDDVSHATADDYFSKVVYTNDPRQVVPICQMLDGLWDRARPDRQS